MPPKPGPPVYSLIASSLRKRILSGELVPGQRIPSESDLCRSFSTSRITIRQALRMLQEEMLVQRFQGRGTFVSPCPTRRIPLLNSDTCGSAMVHAPEMRIRLDDWGWRRASQEVAEQLQALAGQRVLFARRTAVLHGESIAYDDLYLLEACAGVLGKEDLAEPVFVERWRRVESLGLSYATQTIEAVPARHPITEYLSVKRGTPVLKGTEIFFSGDDRPAGMMVMYLRHDIFRLTCLVQLGAGPARGRASGVVAPLRR